MDRTTDFISDEQREAKSPPIRPQKPAQGWRSFVTGEDYCAKAKELLKKRQFRAAQAILQKGLLEVEKKASAYHLLGLAFYHQGLFQLGIQELKKAVEKDPQPEYFFNLSISLNELGRYKEGRTAYEKALRLQKKSQEQNWKEEIAEKHNQTAQVYLKKNQFKPALVEYLKGLKFYANKEAQMQIAQVLWKLNQKHTAFKYLKNFLVRHPTHISARLLLADWYFETKDIPQAVHEWETVLTFSPTNLLARSALLKVQQLGEVF